VVSFAFEPADLSRLRAKEYAVVVLDARALFIFTHGSPAGQSTKIISSIVDEQELSLDCKESTLYTKLIQKTDSVTAFMNPGFTTPDENLDGIGGWL